MRYIEILCDAVDEDKYGSIEEQNQETPMPYETGIINPSSIENDRE